jgi:hypothetical protein
VNDATESRVFEICESVVEKTEPFIPCWRSCLDTLYACGSYAFVVCVNLTSCLDS